MAREMKDSGIEWIGEIPREWEVSKFKFETSGYKAGPFGSALITAKLSNKGRILVYTPEHVALKSDVTSNNLYLPEERRQEMSQFFVNSGDIVFPIVGTLGRSMKITSTMKEGIINQRLAKFRLTSAKVDENYFLWLFSRSSFYEVYIDLYRRGSIIVNLTKEIVNNMPIPLPSLQEQQAIAEFLDTQCAHIDSVIEKTRAAIEEYKKLKQAVITQAVTKGIRPNREMKDSGIEWIGEIPKAWNVQRIKTIFDLRDERNYLPLEEVNLISLYTDKGVVQHSDLEKTTGNKASNADGYKIVYENDIIVNIILCWMGAIGRSSYQGVTSPAYDIYVSSNTIECRFYHHYFRTKGFSGDCYKRGKGIMAMRWRTYSDQFRDIKVVVPPLKEQQEILNYLDEKTAAIDSLIKKKEQLITELEAYKKSLIYEDVTGKKEVK